MIYTLVAICLFGGTLAQQPSGYCKHMTTMQDFNMTAFLGRWYAVGMSRPVSWECLTNDYRHGTGFIAIQGGYDVKSNARCENNNHLAVGKIDASQPGKLRIIYRGTRQQVSQLVLDTDYVSYAIIYECSNIYDEPIMYVMARNRYPRWNYFAKLVHIVGIAENLTGKEISLINQKNCPHLTGDVDYDSQ